MRVNILSNLASAGVKIIFERIRNLNVFLSKLLDFKDLIKYRRTLNKLSYLSDNLDERNQDLSVSKTNHFNRPVFSSFFFQISVNF